MTDGTDARRDKAVAICSPVGEHKNIDLIVKGHIIPHCLHTKVLVILAHLKTDQH